MNQERIEELEQIIKNVGTGGCSSPSAYGKIFEECINLIQPKEILEIGFFCGNSSLMMLELSKQFNTKITSVDPIDNNTTTDYLKSINREDQIQECSVQFAAVDSVFNNYKERFTFVQKRSLNAALDGDLEKNKYQLVFIDGGHEEFNVSIDLEIALALKIPFLLLDDCEPTYPGVAAAFSKMQNRFQIIKYYQKSLGDGADVLFLANLDLVEFKEK